MEATGERLAARRYLYAFFQSVFGNEPSAEQHGAFDAALCEAALSEVGMEPEACGSAARLLAALRGVLASPEEISSLHSEYTRLFVGPGKLPAPPWEGYWRSVEHRLFTRETLEVRQCYRACGFASKGYPRVADDHLAIELDFLSALALRAFDGFQTQDAEAARAALAASRSFLDAHLGRWLADFAQALGPAAGERSLFGAAALALADFAAGDADWLREVLE